ncbi:MAG: sulfur transferase domain-containing protein [Halothece sp. Uz-M2-17]|nr:sulfur transferase domain-containing protein [Halothece sp. Uz-M2-17]
MENTINLSPEFAIAGQITPEQLQRAKEAGYQAVVNLRMPGEQGFIDNQNAAQDAGLHYAHIPVSPSEIGNVADHVINQLDELPKPALVHCGSALRAGVMVLAYMGVRQGKSADTVLEEARQAGFTMIDGKPPLKQFIQDYIAQNA